MKKKTIWGALLAVTALGAYACSSEQRSGEPLGDAQQPVVLSNGNLFDNLTLEDSYSFENTAKVVPPSKRATANCWNGGIALLAGQFTPEFTYRPLIDSQGNIDMTSSLTHVPTPGVTPASQHFPGTDNQMVRLKDGSLLAMRGGGIAAPTSPPLLYANEVIAGIAGSRGALFFYRLTDCGATWTERGVVDYGTFAGGKYGWPCSADAGGNCLPCPAQPPWNWWIGGGDCPEMYACPFTGNIYVTEHLSAGAYCPGGGPTEDVNTMALLMSSDYGATWKLVTDDLKGWTPLVMTSTPDGRLFVLSSWGGVPKVRFSQPGAPGFLPILGNAADVSYIENGVPIPVGTGNGTRGNMLIKSDVNPALAVNAWGGAKEGAVLKLTSACTKTNPDCTWAYRNGMLLSDSDPTLAVVASGDENAPLTLTKFCDASKPECYWTYRKGRFYSDKSPTRAISPTGGVVADGVQLVTSISCDPVGAACNFSLPNVKITSGANASLRVRPDAQAELVLTGRCPPGSTQCRFTFSQGMITSGNLAVTVGGGGSPPPIKLSSGCSATSPSCTWTWSKGVLYNDNPAAAYAIVASGGATELAKLKAGTCAVNDSSCVFAVHNEAVALGHSNQVGLSISRLSTDTTTDRVRVAYTSRNADNMVEARIVNYDIRSTGPATPVATITAGTSPAVHSVMFPTFVEPDYLDMPNDERTNTALLYWEEAPTPSAPLHDYYAKGVIIDGDSTIGSQMFLSVASGSARYWNFVWPTPTPPAPPVDLGDYVNGGFFWRNKTLNYLAQWIETNGGSNVVKANIVSLRSPVHGFLIKSDKDSTLAFKAAGVSAEVKLSNACSASDTTCYWSYRNGMLVNDADPKSALVAMDGLGTVAEGFHAKLSNTCTPDKSGCTWTYKRGEFVSDLDQTLALNAWGGAVNNGTIALKKSCPTSNADCTFTLPNVELSNATDTRLAMYPASGAVNSSQLILSSTCSASSTDCVFTFTKGMIQSGTNSSLMLNAAGGAKDLALVKLSSTCSPTNTSCLWTWTKGEIISDGSTTALPITPSPGAASGATLKLSSACNPSINDCVFAGYYMH